MLGNVSASNSSGENGISDTAERSWRLKHPASGFGRSIKARTNATTTRTDVSSLLARRGDGRNDLELRPERANRAEFETLA